LREGEVMGWAREERGREGEVAACSSSLVPSSLATSLLG